MTRVRQTTPELPTPQRLRWFLRALWALSALLTLVGASMLYGAYNALRTVGRDTAPSIIASQEISAALADLDANAANYLLGSKKNQADATAAFERQRLVATESLVKAANNITYASERAPILTMFDGLGRYLELYAEMRYRHDSGDTAGAATVYSVATDLMHDKLLPSADTLDTVNFAELKSEYERQQRASQGAELVAGTIAAVLVVVLLCVQLFLFRRMRRVLNPPLVGATALATVIAVALVGTIGGARADLKIAKEDAFDSIHALWKASSIAYDANGDESRYLLGGPRAGAYDTAYKTKVAKLTSQAQDVDPIVNARKPPPSYKGLFATELNNITFSGEREAAVKMIRAFAAYDAADTQMRKLEREGRHAEAVDVGIGTKPNQANPCFDIFDQALRAVVQINHKEFDRAVDHGERDLQAMGVVLPIGCLAIAFLALVGIRARLREYAA